MDSKISQLTELTLPAIEDLLPIVDISASLTKKITLATLDARWALKAGLAGGQTIKGGTGVTDILKLQGTSGNGTLTSPAIQALVGNNGATTALTILNNGNVGIGTTGPQAQLDIYSGSYSR